VCPGKEEVKLQKDSLKQINNTATMLCYDLGKAGFVMKTIIICENEIARVEESEINYFSSPKRDLAT
jgi:hypothetical protein